MTYQPAVYREQGGDKLIAKTSGEVEFQTGSALDIQSGSSFTMDAAMEVGSGGAVDIESGGKVTIASGGYVTVPYQTLGSSQTATEIFHYGASLLTGTTTGPVYTLATPIAAGQIKDVILNPTSSGATHRAVIYAGTTSATIVHQSGSGNQVTLNTSAQDHIRLISTNTSSWRVMSGGAVLDPTFSSYSS